MGLCRIKLSLEIMTQTHLISKTLMILYMIAETQKKKALLRVVISSRLISRGSYNVALRLDMDMETSLHNQRA